MKVDLPRACTWTVDSTDLMMGVLTSGDGLVFEMRRCDTGVGWKPVLVGGRATWMAYGQHNYAVTILRRVQESLLEAWAAEVDAQEIPLVVDPRTVEMGVKKALSLRTMH